MRELKTNLEGKIRNLPHFKSEALLPLFEAVVNAIQAIEEKGNTSTGLVNVEVLRSPQLIIHSSEARPVTGFTITDNGIGFTDDNFLSFQTSDTIHKLAKGGKGVGRFLWLKAFGRVEIESVFEEGKSQKKRQFDFSIKSGIGEGVPVSTQEPRQTKVSLLEFKREYQQQPSAFRTTSKIAQRVLEHCLSYFVAGAAPRIVVRDEDETVVLNDIYDSDFRDNVLQQQVRLKGHEFVLTHIKLYATHDRMHNIVLCADRRDVKTISLSRALGTTAQFDDADRKFTYALYVTSPYLDEYCDHYRLDFNLPTDAPLMNGADVLTEPEIMETITNAAREHLGEHLAKTRERKEARVAQHIDNENPALRAVPVYCPEIYDEIDPNSSPARIEEILYQFKGRAEYAIRSKSEELLRTQLASVAEVDESWSHLAQQITAFQKDNLASYLLDRKRIISILEKKLELNKNGKVSNEDIVHDMVFPRKSTSGDINFEDHNLWLIDEVLAFHSFAVSEKPLNATAPSASEDRPDVVIYAEVGDDKVARAVSIVEFKKPQRTKFDEDPTRQIYRYVRQIREAKQIKLPSGRDLHVSSDTRFYCYAVCDLVPAVREYCDNNNYAMLMNELGYYAYNRNHNAHTEVLDFDKIVVDAKRRHRAFFDKLGLP